MIRKIGILGLGQVGSAFSMGFGKYDVDVRGYDKMWETSPFKERILENSKNSGLVLVESVKTLAESVDLIISVTAPHFAIETAKSIAPYLNKNQIYLDLNSATPNVKEQVATLVTPATFIDGAILGSLSQYGHQVPIVLSGQNSENIASFLCERGMDVTSIGTEVGQASALKIIRSIFTKGMECILLECLHAAKYYSIDSLMKESIHDFLENKPLASTIEMLITTNAIHSERRAGEMKGVQRFLNDLNINSTMSEASMQKLQWSSSLNLKEKFSGLIPNDMDIVLEEMIERTKKKT